MDTPRFLFSKLLFSQFQLLHGLLLSSPYLLNLAIEEILEQSAMTPHELKGRKRADYGYTLDYRTRWSDNDMYDHMNNSIYNFLFDSVVNTYLIDECGLRPPTSDQYGLVVHSHTDFFGSIAFPAVAELGLRVNKLGKSSVTYEIALFERGVEEVKAVGELIHVFVERKTGRPSTTGLNADLKDGLRKITAKQSKL